MVPRHRLLEPAVIGLIALAVYLAVAWQLAYRVEAFSIDAMSRSNDARLILFAREPKLADIGFVWMPLPVVQQLPWLLVPALRARGLAASLTTAVMGASLCALFVVFLRQVGLRRLGRWPLVAAFALNPMILMYSANGMSEMSLAFFSLLMIWFYWKWRRDQSWHWLAGAALAAMLAGLTRYEALIMVAALTLLTLAETLVRRRQGRRFVESTLLIFGLPALYAQGFWLLAMWLIMGDPLFFARGNMSNAARVGYQIVDKPWVLVAKGNALVSVGISLHTIWAIAFPFVILSVLVPLASIWRRKWFWLGIVCLAWSSLALATIGLYQGVANFELRYMILAIPMGLLLAIGWFELMPRWRTLTGLALAAAFGVAAWSASQTILYDVAHGDEAPAYQGLLSGQVSPLLQPDIAMARYIDTHGPGTVLLDENTSYGIVFLSKHIDRLVPRSDSLFEPALREPARYVNYILVRRPYREPDAFQRAYPGFYENGAAWARLEVEIGPWRLYSVVGGPGKRVVSRPNVRPPTRAAQVALIGVFGALSVVLAVSLIRRRQTASLLAGAD